MFGFLSGLQIDYSPAKIKSGGLVFIKLKLSPTEKLLSVTEGLNPQNVYPFQSQQETTNPFMSGQSISNHQQYFIFRAFDIDSKQKELTLTIFLSTSNTTLTIPIEIFNAPPVPTGRVDLSSQTKTQVLSDPGKVWMENQFFLRFFSQPPSPTIWWKGRFTLPVLSNNVTSEYGKLRVYNNGTTSFHRGTDFGFEEGSPIFAANRGVVRFAEKTLVRGNMIVVDHGGNLFTSYWHLSKIEVAVGDRVTYGEKIGEVGSTGLTTGPHLHFEARLGAVMFNGLELLGLSNL